MRGVWPWLGLILSLAACAADEALPAPTRTLSPQAAQGAALFSTHCASCHSLAPETRIVGPSLAGIGDRAASRRPEVSAADYLLLSIIEPDAYIVDGFDDLMPANFGKRLTGEEVDALVAYLLSERSAPAP